MHDVADEKKTGVIRQSFHLIFPGNIEKNHTQTKTKGMPIMDFDKNQLETNIIDATRNPDAEALIRALLRYLCTPDDNVVFAAQGVAKMLQSQTSLSRATIFRILSSMEDRRIITTLDEFSLQLNPQFSSKTSKQVFYPGPALVYDDDESKYLQELNAVRVTHWALRGKDKRYVKAEDEMITKLKKKIDEQSDEIAVVRKQNDQMLALLKEILAGQSPAETKAKAERHLTLIDGGKEG